MGNVELWVKEILRTSCFEYLHPLNIAKILISSFEWQKRFFFCFFLFIFCMT